MKTRFAIIGGGLSGLALADHLHRADQDFQLFEARSRFGGRVKTHQLDDGGFDLGPSWYWPGQPRMAALVESLGLTRFDQYAQGALAFETETGDVIRDMGFSSMQGSWRIRGGMAKLVSGLVDRLPADRLHTRTVADKVSDSGTLTFQDGDACQADHIVLALPPRVTAGLTFQPGLDRSVLTALNRIPTWMGGHAKFVAVYEHAFWRDAGLSGDASSRFGPLVEIHDASTDEPGGPAALFGFLGVPAARRKGQQEALTTAAVAQLTRIFGSEANAPLKTLYQDWAFAPQTASPLDHAPLSNHPAYGMPDPLRSVWQGRLHFCATELAPEMGGYLEGALASAEATAQSLLATQKA
jgi:monoamine oxidase